MGQSNIQRGCPHCQSYVLAIKSTPNHAVHAVVSLFTCGCWLIVWIILSVISSTSSYRCSRCGTDLGS
jgi:hypothetical protein